MDEYQILLAFVILVVLPTLLALGSAVFKLGRDLKTFTSTSSDGGVTLTGSEVDTLISDVNAVGKAFRKLAEQLINLYNKIF